MLSITNVVRGLFARSATPSRPRPRRRPLRLECLEERTLLCNPGELDLTFDGDGKVTTDFGGPGPSEKANATVVQPDGKIVVVGYSVRSVNAQGPTDQDWALARYNPNGSLDTSFGSGGKILTSWSKGGGSANDVAIQSDGKIIVAGSAGKQTLDFGVVRYKTDGTLDKSFGSGGKVTVDLGGRDLASSVAIQTDGKILVGGRGTTFCNGCDSPFILLRFNSNGTLDSSFGSGGKVITFSGTPGDDFVADIAIQSNGQIVAAGHTGGEAAVVRWNSNGTLDTAFGVGGIHKLSTGEGSEFYSVAIQTDGRTVAAGGIGGGNANARFAVARFNFDGSLDTTLDTDGIVTTDIAPGTIMNGDYEFATGVAIQPDGRIIAAGNYTYDNPNHRVHFAVVRYNTNGSLDTTFDSDGIVTTGIGISDGASDVVIQPSDGHVVVVGGSDGDFALARYCA